MSRIVMSSATRRAAHFVAAVVGSVVLAACGGGGSGNTVVDKPGVALYTNAGDSLTVAANASSDFTIGGGGGTNKFVSYSAASSDAKVATVAVDGTKLKITGVSAGDATVTVTDSAGGTLKISVKVPGDVLNKIAVNAPDKVTFTPGMTSQYKISGGVGPYSVAISNPNVVAASAGRDAVSVTAANPGTATVIVYDSVGSSARFEVTVTGGGYGVALYTTAPESIRMTANSTAEFTVNGGTGPYVVTSSDPLSATGEIFGSNLTIKAGASGRALLNIRDTTGTLVVVTVNVIGTSTIAMYSTAPSTVTLGASSALTYTVDGGLAPYVASTSNPNVAQASIIAGNQLQIRGISAGVADILVFDSLGNSIKVAATVGGGTGTVPLYSTAPDSITLMVGAKPTYQIAGGAAPYTVTSSNVAVTTVTQSTDSFTVTGVAAGLAVVSLRDANGSAVTIQVDVR